MIDGGARAQKVNVAPFGGHSAGLKTNESQGMVSKGVKGPLYRKVQWYAGLSDLNVC